MARGARNARRVWWAVLVGLVWAQGTIAFEFTVLPRCISPGDRISGAWWYLVARGVLLAPLELATRLAALLSEPDAPGAAAGSALAALVLCPLFGAGLCLVAVGLGASQWRRPLMAFLSGLGLLGGVCAVAVALQVGRAATAERTFFALVSRVEVAHKDAETVSAARQFVRRHPDSRWAGEAMRIVATAEWDAGHFEQAADLWNRFGARFRDRSAPGVAYAEYSIALCDERLGRYRAAQQHLRAAVEIIRMRNDGIQGWIAVEAAARLSAFERSEGRYALAGYWKEESSAFSNANSIE